MPLPLFTQTKYRTWPGICLAAFLCLQSVAAADEPESIATLRRRAETGLPAAQYMLGNAFISGEGVEENPSEAAQWYRRAAEQGHAEAQFNLGMMFSEGVGVPVDKSAAAHWYTAAASRGVAEAQYNLAVAFSKGEGVPQNQVEAFKWYQSAAEAWDTRAQLQVGLAYRDGVGVEPNEAEAIKWLRRAAYQNEPAAQYSLGLIYGNTNSAHHSFEDAKRWVTRAAELNYGPALALANGTTNQAAATGMTPEATRSLIARASLGTIGTNLVSQAAPATPQAAIASQMAAVLETSDALPSNAAVQPAPAFGQLSEFTNQTRVAEGGAADAQYSMAISFLMGEQGEPDILKAIPWLEKAAAQQHARADSLLKKLKDFQAPGGAPKQVEATLPVQAPTPAGSAPAPLSGSSKPIGLGTIMMISIGSSLFVIGGTAALLFWLMKTRFSRMQRELFETKIELAEANKNVKKLTSFIQAIETRMLEASLEPPPLPAKASRPLPDAHPKGATSPADPGVDLKVKRARGKSVSEVLDRL